MKIIIEGEFPTLNQVIKASKSHYMAYANQKKQFTTLTMLSVKNKPKIDFKANYHFTWYRKTKRADPDNVTVGQKYVFDGLIKAGLIENDGWKEVGNISHSFRIDKENPRLELEVTECITA